MRLTRVLHLVSAKRRGGRLHSRLSRCVGALVMAACVSGFAVAPASAEQAASRALAFQHGLLDAGSHHTCAIVGGGDVRCWGEGGDGRLGYGNVDDIGDTETPASVPPVALGGKAVAVSAGGAHTCAVLETGVVRCWGYGNDGQLGYGNGDSIGDTETPAGVAPVALGARATAISAGDQHTCALLETGAVRCWGYGGEGSLGYGNADSIGDTETPAGVAPVALGAKAVAISAGAYHSCALLETGRVRCWGYNGEGELGYGHYDTIGDTETPGSVDPVALGGDAVAISAGGYHSCALLDSGVVRCWGYNADGQLGYGNTMDIGGTEQPASVGPVALGAGAVAVSAGEYHSCALLATTRVRCWGLGAQGRLGYGGVADLGDAQTPDQVQPLTLSGPASAITAGGSHTCAVQANGPVDQVACWGRGSFGQLGYGNASDIADEPEEGPDFGGGVALGGSVVTVAPVCANLVDDNGDMLTDFPADPDCASPWGSSEGAQVVEPPPPPPPPPAACNDGIDNDADGAADFPADPGCDSSGDADETNARVPVNARPDSDIAPLKSRIRAGKLKRLRGSASDADGQVAKVHIAVERRTGTGSGTRCRALAKTGRLKRHKAVKGACKPRIWIKANGTTAWSYRLKRALPAGRYTLYSRATDNLKLREAGFSKADGTKRVIRIRP